MIELEKYSKQDSFYFAPGVRLSQVCNAPGRKYKYGGIYLLYAIKDDQEIELVYIGISGKLDKSTRELIPRRDGIKGRIVKGKRDGEPRKNYWFRQMEIEGFDALRICWYVVHDNEVFKDCPETLERKLITKYKPRWNRR
tara:strand:+ start:269 stop:688 length:420 start_codon:yes stop_codon:yes gene_type:complete